MTVLAVAQQVALAVGIKRPIAVFASTDRDMQELQAVLNEAVAVIGEAFDWQALRKVQTLTGDGSTEAWPLPTDYARMPATGNLWSGRSRGEMMHITDPDEWLSFDIYPVGPIHGVWSLFGGTLNIRPVLAVNETAKFFYIRAGIVGATGTAFTDDAQAFALDERLLKLCATYLWKQQKGQDFTAELTDYEMALQKAMDRDGGSKPVVSGNQVASRRAGRNVWPGSVTGAP